MVTNPFIVIQGPRSWSRPLCHLVLWNRVLEPSLNIHDIHICNFRLRVYTFLLVLFDSLAGTAFLVRSMTLCLVDNQRSSAVMVAGFESCWFEPGSPTSSSPQSNLPITSRKIGPDPHQLVSDISGLPWGIISFALDSYLFITYNPQKTQKYLIFHCPITIVPCNFVFRFALLSLCPWLSLVAGFDCVRHRSSFAPLLFLVSATIPSTVFQTTSRSHHITRLASASRLVWSLTASLNLDRLPTAVILPASQHSLHHQANTYCC